MSKITTAVGVAFISTGVLAGALNLQKTDVSDGKERTRQVLHLGHNAEHSIEQDRLAHGKPGVDIRNQDNTRYFLDVHEQKSIELVLKIEQTGGTVDVHVEADDGLMIVGAQVDWQYNITDVQTLNLPVTLYGAAEGTHYVHIFTTFTDEYGQVSSRALAQQVDVGVSSIDIHRYKSASTFTAAPYIKLPVQEVIH